MTDYEKSFPSYGVNFPFENATVKIIMLLIFIYIYICNYVYTDIAYMYIWLK